MFYFPFPNWKRLEQTLNSAITTSSWYNLKALLHLFSSSSCSSSAGPFSLLQFAKGFIAENTDQFITHFSLLFLFVLNVGFVTSSSAISLPSAALLGIT